MSRKLILTLAALALLPAPWARALPSAAEDDLAVVKRATGGLRHDLALVKRGIAASEAYRSSGAAPPTVTRKAGREPEWLKVRVVEKAAKKARVTVNLPLGIARLVEDVPVQWRCAKDEKGPVRRSIKLADVLRMLEAGQELVEIDDEDATVRIWVE
jgi:hypothetical protein